jgi:hypothetical protein
MGRGLTASAFLLALWVSENTYSRQLVNRAKLRALAGTRCLALSGA